jgi:hypothetical protein
MTAVRMYESLAAGTEAGREGQADGSRRGGGKVTAAVCLSTVYYYPEV